MNTLKELNLISVLKNMNEEKLKEILYKSDNLKIYNLINTSKCSECNDFIDNHRMCSDCNKIKCYTLWDGQFIHKCIGCLSRGYKISYHGKYAMIDKLGDDVFFLHIKVNKKRVKNGYISYNNLLKILKYDKIVKRYRILYI